MSIDNAIYALSNVNAILGSTTGLIRDRQNGLDTGDAIRNFGLNIMHGAFRNAASRDIQRFTGSYWGYALNAAAGYGSPEANYRGTVGTMGAAMISSPFSLFACSPYSTLYGCGPMYAYPSMYRFGPMGGFCSPFGPPSYFAPRGYCC